MMFVIETDLSNDVNFYAAELFFYFFPHLNLELPSQFAASNDDNFLIFVKNSLRLDLLFDQLLAFYKIFYQFSGV